MDSAPATFEIPAIEQEYEHRAPSANSVEQSSALLPKTFAEFFAGIGLMRMGLERLGWNVRFANDIDVEKCSMYQAHFRDRKPHFILGDIHGLPADCIPPVTLATASFPCNDLSLAGARDGLRGRQSSAFWGFIRVLEDMGSSRPPIVLIEDVPEFLSSHGGADFADALRALNSLGYFVDPFMIDAANFVPQSRVRLFVVGVSENDRIRKRGCELRAVKDASWQHTDVSTTPSILQIQSMPDETLELLLPTEALVVAYAMSRLNEVYLAGRSLTKWKDAFDQASRALNVKATSINNLRDEFDPVFGHRKGWRNRPMRADRLRVMGDLAEVTDEALLAMVDRILARDQEAVVEAITSLADPSRPAYNVAERQLTGRKAEDYFLEHCERIVSIERSEILDLRQSAQGFDFGITFRNEVGIEVKGMKESRGAIQFTDREWTVAGERKEDYWLVVIGNIAREPNHRVIPNPRSVLSATCRFQRSLTAIWQSQITI